MKFYGLKLQSKVSCKNRLKWDIRVNEKLPKLKSNGNIVKINDKGI
jgi:hypothetical protein